MEDEARYICERSLGGKPGRPRSEAARQAILRAAHELLVRDGFASITMEAIAAEAGVSKATLYRWWECKATVVMDAFIAANGPCYAGQDTGNLREDLRRRIRGMCQAFAGPFGTVIAGMVAEMQADPFAANAFRQQYLAPRYAETMQSLAEAKQRGQIRAEADLEAVADALFGPIYFRLLTGHAPLTPTFADGLVETVLNGVLPK